MKLVNPSESNDVDIPNRFADTLRTDVDSAKGTTAFPNAYRLALTEQAMRAVRQIECLAAENTSIQDGGLLVLRNLPPLSVYDIEG